MFPSSHQLHKGKLFFFPRVEMPQKSPRLAVKWLVRLRSRTALLKVCHHVLPLLHYKWHYVLLVKRIAQFLKLLQFSDLKHFLLFYRLGAVSLLLWLPTNPDPWWLAGAEGGGQVGVWSGGSHDICVHSFNPPGCLYQCLVAGGSPHTGGVLWG